MLTNVQWDQNQGGEEAGPVCHEVEKNAEWLGMMEAGLGDEFDFHLSSRATWGWSRHHAAPQSPHLPHG